MIFVFSKSRIRPWKTESGRGAGAGSYVKSAVVSDSRQTYKYQVKTGQIISERP
jgi:hypothetical protein